MNVCVELIVLFVTASRISVGDLMSARVGVSSYSECKPLMEFQEALDIFFRILLGC